MNNLQVFNSQEFGQIRTASIDGDPWFAGKDVATALGYKNTKDAIINHVSDEDKRILQRSEIATIENHLPKDVFPVNFVSGEIPNRGLTIINESGLYALIFGSKLESAKRFKHWVTSEVLPTIRKTGSYELQGYSPEMKAILMHDKKIVSMENRISDLESNTTLDYGQQQALGDVVNRVVIDCLGGKNSPAYQEIGRKVFAECNRDLKHYFNVNARNNVPKKRFEEAVQYAKDWHPSTNTQIMIRDRNAQISMC